MVPPLVEYKIGSYNNSVRREKNRNINKENLSFSKRFLELVTTAPPSPVVKTLFPAKLKIPIEANVPIFFLLISEPKDSAASSMTVIFFSSASSHISLILHAVPA